jgi:HEAT repeat protein
VRHFLRLAVVGLALWAGGCGKARPTTAGGKPVSHWVQALQDPDARLRKKAAQKLGNAGPADPAVVPALAGALKDRDARVRAEAALALMKMGPAAQGAIPALAEAHKDPDPRVREYAVKALERVQAAR